MTPPEALRMAAQLLEEAHRHRDASRAKKLAEVRSICAAIITQIDNMSDPIEQAGSLARMQRIQRRTR